MFTKKLLCSVCSYYPTIHDALKDIHVLPEVGCPHNFWVCNGRCNLVRQEELSMLIRLIYLSYGLIFYLMLLAFI